MKFDLPKEPVKRFSAASAWADKYTPEEMKERFLIQFRIHRNAAKACKEVGLPVPTHTLWRKKDAVYAKACQEVIDGTDSGLAVEVVNSALVSEINHPVRGSKQDCYIKRYRLNRSRADACVYTRVPVSTYEDWRDPAHSMYDKDFDDLMYSEEQFDMWAIEDMALANAAAGQGNNVQFFLERRMKDTYGPPVRRTENANSITHWFTRQGEESAREVSEKLLSTTFVTEDVTGSQESTDPN